MPLDSRIQRVGIDAPASMRHPTPVPRLIPVLGSVLGPLVVGLLASCLCGCGIHHYDAKTGVEHLWGFGHLRMRVHPPTNGVQAVITGNQLVGVRVGAGTADYGLSVGYDNRRWIVINPGPAPLTLGWPTADFFNFRIGTNLPPFPQISQETLE